MNAPIKRVLPTILGDVDVMLAHLAAAPGGQSHVRPGRICPHRNHLCCRVTVDCPVQFVLGHGEKVLRDFRMLVVIRAGRVDVLDLLVKILFRRPDFPDAGQQLVKISAALFQPFIVQREPLHDEFPQPLRRPDAELRAAQRFYPVANGDDHVEIVVNRLVGFPVVGSSCIICTYCLLRQFSLLENVADVLGDDGAFPLKQLRHLVLGEPDRFVFQLYLQPGAAILCLIEDNLGFTFWFLGHVSLRSLRLNQFLLARLGWRLGQVIHLQRNNRHVPTRSARAPPWESSSLSDSDIQSDSKTSYADTWFRQ